MVDVLVVQLCSITVLLILLRVWVTTLSRPLLSKKSILAGGCCLVLVCLLLSFSVSLEYCVWLAWSSLCLMSVCWGVVCCGPGLVTEDLCWGVEGERFAVSVVLTARSWVQSVSVWSSSVADWTERLSEAAGWEIVPSAHQNTGITGISSVKWNHQYSSEITLSESWLNF